MARHDRSSVQTVEPNCNRRKKIKTKILIPVLEQTRTVSLKVPVPFKKKYRIGIGGSVPVLEPSIPATFLFFLNFSLLSFEF